MIQLHHPIQHDSSFLVALHTLLQFLESMIRKAGQVDGRYDDFWEMQRLGRK